MIIFSVLYAYGFVLINMLLYLINSALKKRTYRTGFVIFLICLGVISFSIEPGRTSDLRTHYIHVSQIDNLMHLRSYIQETGLFIWGCFLFLVNKIDNLHFLPLIVNFITEIFLILFVKKCHAKFTFTVSDYSLYLFMLVGLVPWQTFFSGLRSTMAFSAICLAVALIIFDGKDHNRLFVIALLTFAIGIHPSSMIAVVMVIFSMKGKTYLIVRIILCTWSLFAATIAKILRNVPISSLSYAGYKLELYLGDSLKLDNAMIVAQVAFIIVTVFELLVLYKTFRYKDISREEFFALSIYENFVLLIVGSLAVELAFRRFILFIGYFTLPFIYIKRNHMRKDLVRIFNCLEVCILLVMIVHNHVKISSHMSF